MVSPATDPTALGVKGQRQLPTCPKTKARGTQATWPPPGPRVPRAGPGQRSPPPFPHPGCGGRGPGPGQHRQETTLVASGRQALPLDYRRGIILPFPALPLRVAPEHPGKPPGVSTALGHGQGDRHKRTDARARGPAGPLGRWPWRRGPGCLALSRPSPRQARCSLCARRGTARPHSLGAGPWPAQTCWGRRAAWGQLCALGLEGPRSTYEMLAAWPEGAA